MIPQAPPPPPGAPTPSRNADFNVGDALNYAWAAYRKNLGPLLLITLVIFVLQLIVNLLGRSSTSTFMNVVFVVGGFVVATILAMGLLRASLSVVRGETPSVNQLTETEGLGSYLVASILFGINVIGAMACGVGLLFTYGITAITIAYAYRTLNGESVAPIA